MKQIGLIFMFSLAWGCFAQWPKEIKNLKVLPEDSSRKKIGEIMFSFNRALGVRCIYCHVGEEGALLEDYDFASDDKETKIKARAMLAMVIDMNEKHLDTLDIKVDCQTCHRGVTEVKPLETIMAASFEETGIEGVNADYRSLRKKHHGRGRYDFGGSSLNRFAFVLEQKDNLEAAESVHRLNLEFNPNYDHSHFKLGTFAFLEGDRNEATTRFRTALTGKPRNLPIWLTNFGRDLNKKGETAQATEVARIMIALAPEQPHGYYLLGETHLGKGENDAARVQFRKAVALRPEFTPAKRALAKLDGPGD